MVIDGNTNDYFGKGLSGATIIVRKPKKATFKSHENIITGNVALYGATSGEAYINGIAGERFCVRNSGAYSVVEGIGDNGCEYMTGGIVAVLGPVGVNFGAGMTGGFAYLMDDNDDLDNRVNQDLIEIMPVDGKAILVEHLRGLINQHYEETGSDHSLGLLTDFAATLKRFKLIKPKTSDVKNLLGHISRSSAELRIQAQ